MMMIFLTMNNDSDGGISDDDGDFVDLIEEVVLQSRQHYRLTICLCFFLVWQIVRRL